jgi:hypothetical protein
MKGSIQSDHMPTNKYELLIIGLPSITAVEISGMEDELQTTELPDRTVASGGNRGATEFTLSVPMHHTIEQLAMELWFKESQDPISPGYKKPGTLIHKSSSGNAFRSFTLVGAFPKKRALPDLEMGAEGEMANVEWTISVDDLLPI